MEKQNKELRKTIRFTKDELEQILNLASNQQMKFSEYIIYSALNKTTASKKNPLYKELIIGLARVGNNLNQIAKICNTERQINKSIASNLILIIAELQTKINEITKKLNE